MDCILPGGPWTKWNLINKGRDVQQFSTDIKSIQFLVFLHLKKTNDGDHVDNDNADDDDGNGEEDVDDDIVECT